MLVQKIQASYYSPNIYKNQPAFGKKKVNFNVENKNPMVKPEVRELAGQINDFSTV